MIATQLRVSGPYYLVLNRQHMLKKLAFAGLASVDVSGGCTCTVQPGRHDTRVWYYRFYSQVTRGGQSMRHLCPQELQLKFCKLSFSVLVGTITNSVFRLPHLLHGSIPSPASKPIAKLY